MGCGSSNLRTDQSVISTNATYTNTSNIDLSVLGVKTGVNTELLQIPLKDSTYSLNCKSPHSENEYNNVFEASNLPDSDARITNHDVPFKETECKNSLKTNNLRKTTPSMSNQLEIQYTGDGIIQTSKSFNSYEGQLNMSPQTYKYNDDADDEDDEDLDEDADNGGENDDTHTLNSYHHYEHQYDLHSDNEKYFLQEQQSLDIYEPCEQNINNSISTWEVEHTYYITQTVNNSIVTTTQSREEQAKVTENNSMNDVFDENIKMEDVTTNLTNVYIINDQELVEQQNRTNVISSGVIQTPGDDGN